MCEMSGMFMALNPYLYPRSYLIRSHPGDTARSEARTFVCGPMNEKLYQVPLSAIPKDLGFGYGCRAGESVSGSKDAELNTEQMRELLYHEFTGCMAGRTMWIVPFSMGPLNSEFCKLGIEISDSPYVVAHMYTMARTGIEVLKRLSAPNAYFLPCWHSVGLPLTPGEKDVPWPCRKENNRKFIAHFTTADPSCPEMGPYSVMSIGSGYGGNALLGKKCYALRIASRMAAFEPVKWMAEHMLILHVRHTPKGAPAKDYFLTGAFPSACGKTNLAMVEVPREFADEWKVTCLGDDIAWIRMDTQGRLCALNPEAGFFGVAPGTSNESNGNAMAAMRAGNTLFTNVGVTRDGDVWWKGKSPEMPEHLIDWHGVPVETHGLDKEALSKLQNTIAQPNSRYTTPCVQCPSVDPLWNAGEGVPIDAFLFGGRRRSLTPLVFRCPDWEDGVLTGATLRSEQTAAADRPEGSLFFDPMAMRPFIGYNMGKYFDHWLEMGRLAPNHPDIYCVNWFRRAKEGKKDFLWAGFGQNFRVLRWICELAQAKRDGRPLPQANTPLGLVPTCQDLLLDREGVHVGPLPAGMTAPKPMGCSCILEVTPTDPEWHQELLDERAFLDLLGSDLSEGMKTAYNRRVDRFLASGLDQTLARLKYPLGAHPMQLA
eukprot:GAFH01000890.1.p2 GENE.GAFH01000890.1~~GAFH01000890.1.p2  ORF type:complete len:728 (-),score=297.17 GAFH01000890.1:289-2253(-)